jgi:hypothetical protein
LVLPLVILVLGAFACLLMTRPKASRPAARTAELVTEPA